MLQVPSAMKCPDADTLRALLEGSLSGEPEASLVAHVEQCPDCQQHLERLTCPVPDDTMTSGQKQVWGCVFTPESQDTQDKDSNDTGGRAAETACDRVPSAGVPRAEFLPEVPGYDLLEEIGRGGMGVVYRGRHRKLDREVAIKTIPLTGRHAGRSEREILAAGRLQHPNIVQTHDAGETDSVAWIVMELLNGDHLGQLLESASGSNREALSFTTVADYIRQAAEGLQEVHDAGLVHRDVKPSNLMVTADGQVKLLDLGLVTCGGDAVDAVDGSITDETTIMGSFDYIAPEQGRDAMSADHRADIYGLGCSLFALLTGRPPFSSDQFRNASQKLIAHACEPRPNARDFNPDVPEELAKLAQGMMSIEPADRPQAASEVASVLTQFCGGDSGTTHRKWTAAAAFGGLILALGVIITIKLNSGRTIRVESDEPVTSIRMENTESGNVTSISIESSQSATTGRQPSRRSVDGRGDLRSAKSAGSGDPRTAGSGDPRTGGSGDLRTVKGDLGGAAAWPDDAPAVAKLPFDPEAALRHQQEWAEYVRLPVVQENSLGMPMRLIPPGEFEMGMKEEQVQTLLDRWEESTGKSFAGTGASWWKMAQRHRVELSNPILVSQHEVTFQNYETLTGEDLRKSARAIDSYPAAVGEMANCPVKVSWIAAARFCNALSVSEGLDSYYRITDDDVVQINGGDGYRMLTEAEWEFACRSGSDEMFWTDGVHPELSHYAVITTSNPQPDFVQPAVGTRAPNGFGLQDMLSIPQDWCYDWYDIDWYEKSPAVNPIGPRLCRSHCIRGASRYSLPFRVGSAFRGRGGQFPHAKINAIRLCRTITAAVAGLPTEPLTSTEGLPQPASNINGGGDLRSAKSAGSAETRGHSRECGVGRPAHRRGPAHSRPFH